MLFFLSCPLLSCFKLSYLLFSVFFILSVFLVVFVCFVFLVSTFFKSKKQEIIAFTKIKAEREME